MSRTSHVKPWLIRKIPRLVLNLCSTCHIEVISKEGKSDIHAESNRCYKSHTHDGTHVFFRVEWNFNVFTATTEKATAAKHLKYITFHKAISKSGRYG